MTKYFIQNLYFGKHLEDDQLAEIPHPRMELYIHVCYKNVELGTFLGMGVIGPLVALYRGRSLGAIKAAALRGGRIGAMVGVPVTPIMIETLLWNATPESVYDRAYRIRNKLGQVRTDRFVTVGSIAGAGASLAMGHPALNGFLLGVVASTFTAGVYNNAVLPLVEKI